MSRSTPALAFDDTVAQSAARVRATGRQPRIAVLLGSGWHDFASAVRDADISLGFLSAACRYFIYAIWPTLRPGLPEFQE